MIPDLDLPNNLKEDQGVMKMFFSVRFVFLLGDILECGETRLYLQLVEEKYDSVVW